MSTFLLYWTLGDFDYSRQFDISAILDIWPFLRYRKFQHFDDTGHFYDTGHHGQAVIECCNSVKLSVRQNIMAG